MFHKFATPEGMQWYGSSTHVDPFSALSGDWTPETRPNLTALIAYLEQDDVVEALDALSKIEHGVFADVYGDGRGFLSSQAKLMTQLLLVRSRYRAESLEDLSRSFDDIMLAYRVAAMMKDSGGIGPYYRSTSAVFTISRSVRLFSGRHKLTRDHVTQLEDWMGSAFASLEEGFAAFIRNSVALDLQTLDHAYTCDERGDGWLVLSSYEHIRRQEFASTRRSGAWNLGSVFFNSRRAVLSKIRAEETELRRSVGMGYVDEALFLRDHAQWPTWNVLDGPFGDRDAGVRSSLMVRRVHAQLRSALIFAAISAYKADFGCYPASLDVLVPDFLKEVPSDPFLAGPMGYRLDNGSFVLYSAGLNGRDDRGTKHKMNREDNLKSEGDFIYTADPGHILETHLRKVDD